jgi:hypothetical protein
MILGGFCFGVFLLLKMFRKGMLSPGRLLVLQSCARSWDRRDNRTGHGGSCAILHESDMALFLFLVG